jgi:zinc/manganese transport system substrate-binding protein
VTTLVPPDRDPHYLLARPSMMVALRRADLLVAVGADLEVGWLPAAIQGANNPRIVPGSPGYFEGAAHISLIERDEAADRARGDVHPAGNPHYYMDPPRMAQVGRALARVLGTLDPAGRAEYERRADAFASRGRGTASHAGASGRPARPASCSSTRTATTWPRCSTSPSSASSSRCRASRQRRPTCATWCAGCPDTRGVILYNTFHPRDGPEFLSRNLGWPTRQLQLEAALDATGTAYLDHIDTWVAALAGRGA